MCDDVRFPNEVAAIDALGGWLVGVVRPGLACAGGHVSEAGQSRLRPHTVLLNDGGLAALSCGVAYMLGVR